MIISLSGRQRAGKTLLANELIKQGFQKISFADRLRELISELYQIPIEDLANPEIKNKNLDEPLVWNEKYAKILGDIIGAKQKLYSEYFEFPTYRKALQYIGTSVLRKYDYDFHVKETGKRLKDNINYIFDDVRFLNELNLLKERCATCAYITRPFDSGYSNHVSETQLSRNDFDYWILNDGSIKQVLYKFEMFLQDFESCKKSEVYDVFLEPNKENSYWAGFICGGENFLHNGYLDLFSRDVNVLKKFKNFVKFGNIRSFGEGYGGFVETQCPYIVDDLKRWNIDKSIPKFKKKIPDCIRDNDYLIKHWIRGLVDGNGHIGSDYVCIFSSNEVIDFVKNKFKNIDCEVKEFELRFNNKPLFLESINYEI